MRWIHTQCSDILQAATWVIQPKYRTFCYKPYQLVIVGTELNPYGSGLRLFLAR